MAESLSTRVGRIVSGGAHALLNALEDAAPEMVMEEAIREVEKAGDEVRTELGRVLARRHMASTRLAAEKTRHQALAAEIEDALGEGRDDLAEAAVAQQLDIEAQFPVLERTLSECAEREKELEGYAAALQGRRREMDEELAQLRRARAQGVAPGDPPRDGSNGAQRRGEKASRVFERVLQRSTGLPTGRDALHDAARLKELEALARRNRIRERLAEARARLDS